MTYQDYRVGREPRGATLAAILRLSMRYCDQFLFALTTMRLSPRAEKTIDALVPFLIDCSDASEYPAGRLPWGTIRVCRYELTPSAVHLLTQTANGLYEWQEPDLPNNLCLMRGDFAWLTTMASDRVAVLSLTSSEKAEICEDIPELSLKVMEG